MPEQQRLYAAIDPMGRFRFASVRQQKRDVPITESDKKYGGESVKKVFLSLVADEAPLPAASDDWAAIHSGWIIQNPDDSFWMDTLSQSEVYTRAWWGDAERGAKREAIGFKVVRVQLATARAQLATA